MMAERYLNPIFTFFGNIIDVFLPNREVIWRLEHLNGLIDAATKERILDDLENLAPNIRIIPTLIDGGIEIKILNIKSYFWINYYIFMKNYKEFNFKFKPKGYFRAKQYRFQMQQRYTEDNIKSIVTGSNIEDGISGSKWNCRVVPPNQIDGLYTYLLTVDHVSFHQIENLVVNRTLNFRTETITLEPIF